MRTFLMCSACAPTIVLIWLPIINVIGLNANMGSDAALLTTCPGPLRFLPLSFV